MRERTISFRMSEEEFARIEALSAHRLTPMSQIIRQAVLKTAADWEEDAKRLVRIEEKLDALLKRRGNHG